MTPNEQTVVDQEESPISLSQCFTKAASAEFIFDVTLSTAVAANVSANLWRPFLTVRSRQTCSTR
jgi:hypothetical protein